MVLHELATNAVKYGALSNLTGTVTIAWERQNGDNVDFLKLRWVETGGPEVSSPDRKGFGSRMISRALRGEGCGAEFDFRPEGLCVQLRFTFP